MRCPKCSKDNKVKVELNMEDNAINIVVVSVITQEIS